MPTAIASKSTTAPKARKTRTRKATPKATPVAKVTTTKIISGKVVEKKSEFVKPDVTLITPAQYKQDILNRWAIHQYEVQELIKDFQKALDFVTPYHTELVKRVKAVNL
jgi:hypothetical protein